MIIPNAQVGGCPHISNSYFCAKMLDKQLNDNFSLWYLSHWFSKFNHQFPMVYHSSTTKRSKTKALAARLHFSVISDFAKQEN